MVKLVFSSGLNEEVLILAISLVYCPYYRVWDALGRLGVTPSISQMSAGLRAGGSPCCCSVARPWGCQRYISAIRLSKPCLGSPHGCLFANVETRSKNSSSLATASECFNFSCRDPSREIHLLTFPYMWEGLKRCRELHFFSVSTNVKKKKNAKSFANQSSPSWTFGPPQLLLKEPSWLWSLTQVFRTSLVVSRTEEHLGLP